MQGMSPQVAVPQWNPVEEEQARANLQGKRTGNETALLTLFEQKQKQAAEQEFLNAVKNDPARRPAAAGHDRLACRRGLVARLPRPR